MAVAVNRDLTVQVLADTNAVKLLDSKQALRAAVQRGEPKCLGVSEIMLGLLVMLYSIPLHMGEYTEAVTLGVPWWSGVAFIISGATAIELDKYGTMKRLLVCLVVSFVSGVVALMAVLIYSVDIERNPEAPCGDQRCESCINECTDEHYNTKLTKGLKSVLLVFTLAQTVISLVLCFQLFRQKRNFQAYNPLNQDTISAAVNTEESAQLSSS